MPKKGSTAVKSEAGASDGPSDTVEEIRTRVHCAPRSVVNASGMDYAGAMAASNVDNSFDHEKFRRGLKIEVKELDEEHMVFEMSGVDAPIANAFRRILLSEVPTMAIEKVFVTNNTSVIQDEVLAHRLGLIPIKVDPRLFDFKEEDQEETGSNTIRFNLDIRCEHNPEGRNKPSPEEKYINSNVFSHHLRWDPLDGQDEKFPEGISCVVDDILIAKMRPGQEIALQCVCEKGVGKTHAKWSPCATASYRLLPDIKIVHEATGSLAEEIKNVCPMGVFDIEDIEGVSHLKAARPRNCTMCRECVRSEKHQQHVKLLRVRDHFIFSIETTGALAPAVLFEEAVKVFISKCTSTLAKLDESLEN